MNSKNDDSAGALKRLLLLVLIAASSGQTVDEAASIENSTAGSDESEVHTNKVYQTYVLQGNQLLFKELFGRSNNFLSTVPYCYTEEINETSSGPIRPSNLTIEQYTALMESRKTAPLTVTLWLQLLQMVELNERSQTMTMVISTQLIWTDCRLQWSADDFGVRELRLAPSMFRQLNLFTPGVRLLQALDPQGCENSETQIRITSSGSVWVTEEYSSIFSCDIEVDMYPFDIQICYLTFESVLSEDIVNMEYSRSTVMEESVYFLNRYIRSEQWSLTIFPPEVSRRTMCFGNEVSPTCTNDGLKFKIILRRNPNYQLINLFFPAFLIVVISSCVFLVPPGGGDKMGLSVSILLSLYMFSQLMYGKMPETGSIIPLLSQYFLVCIVLVSASCLYSSFSAVFATACPRLPPYLREFVVLLAPIFMFDLVRDTRNRKRVVENRANHNLEAHGNPETCDNEPESHSHDVGEEDRPNEFSGFDLCTPERVTWSVLGALLDRIFFALHLLVSISVMVIYLAQGYGPWIGYAALNLDKDQRSYVCAQLALENKTSSDVFCDDIVFNDEEDDYFA